MKTYVSTLRVKGIEYKRKRAELAEIRDEVSVLSRTEEILRSKDDSVGDYLVSQTGGYLELFYGLIE